MDFPLHVEIVQTKRSCASKDYIITIVNSYLSTFVKLLPGAVFTNNDMDEFIEMKEHVQYVSICDLYYESEVLMTDMNLVYHVYKLDSFGPETDTMSDTSSGEELSAADIWTLPNEEFHGLWENLVYDTKLKAETLRFVETAFEFTDCSVDPNIISWNRVVLLHGPPGTGKTSLCRALAHKLAIRLQERFPRARLLEINAHSLFSKWFSESGKLISRLFERIHEIVEDKKMLTCILVDEVESLAHARRSALSGLEPSDAIRSVNAILTQLDRLKRHPNALVLTTSNMTGAIDIAFVDRADIKRYVGSPGERAAYKILRGCCTELMSKGIVKPLENLFALHVLEAVRFNETEESAASLKLWHVARNVVAAKLSARALRRLPFLARALHCSVRTPPTYNQFIEGLQAALQQHLLDCEEFEVIPDKSNKANVQFSNGY